MIIQARQELAWGRAFSFSWGSALVILGLLGILAGFLCQERGKSPAAAGLMTAVPEKPETLVLTEGRFSGWQGGRRLYLLEVASLTAVPKQWGPFAFQDLRDFMLAGCRLQVEEGDLAAIWQQLGKSLGALACAPAQRNLHTLDQGAGLAAPVFRLVSVPPAITARPFACRLQTGAGEYVTLEAEGASCQPSEPVLHLTGAVRVRGASGASLESAALDWWFEEQKIKAPGPYDYREGRKLLQGRQGHFSLAHGELLPDKTAPKAPAPAPSAAALPPFPVMAVNAALPGKKNPLVTFFSLMMLSSCSLGEPAPMTVPAPVR